jgi:multiple sugar transport system ATP-binding protein
MAQVQLLQLEKSFSQTKNRAKKGQNDPATTPAVDDVSLEIADGELLVLVGPSGCGKSTTLRLIAGLEDLDSGEIKIGDRRVDQLAPKDRNIAMVFQNYALYPHMTVYDNLAFGLRLRSGGGIASRMFRRMFSPEKAKELDAQRLKIPSKIEAVAKKLGIFELLRRMPRELSGGERQRVALGRAIVREPAAFLFDEPLSNLDAKLRVEMRREIKRLHQELAATMIYVTHDQVEAMTLGDRIAIMNHGKIVQCDTPQRIYAAPQHRFVAGFIGSPPMNLIRGKIQPCPTNGSQKEFEAGGFRVALAGNLPNEEVELGVRPEVVLVNPKQSESPDTLELGEGKVELVESLGDSHITQFQLGNVQLLARTSDCQVHAGDTCRLSCPEDAIHFFDGKTGKRIDLGLSSV